MAAPGYTNRPKSPTVGAAGAVTAPGAGGAIASLASGKLATQGRYVVFVIAGYGAGTAPAAGENGNMQLQAGATVVAALAVPGAITVVPFTFVVDLDGATPLSVNAIGVGTGGVVYLAGIYAYPLTENLA